MDCLFLDCTFGKEAVRMPHREEAIKQVKQCIWNHPEASTVYLACDLLGQELLLRNLSCAFGFKIFVDKHHLPDFYGSLTVVAPDLITDDPKSTRLHVCEGFPKLYERAKQKFASAYARGEPEPLFIRPSAQWYTYGERLEGVGSGLILLEKIYEKAPSITRRRAKSAPTEAERDPFGIWHVCYSMHSSQEELELFMPKLKPRQVISTTPHCKATELSYVRALKFSAAHERAVSKTISMPVKVLKEQKNAIENIEDRLSTEGKNTTEPPWLQILSPVRHIPLFGMAVAGLLPSPPLSFDSDEDGPSENVEDTAHFPSPAKDPSHAQNPVGKQSPVSEYSTSSRDLCLSQCPIHNDLVRRSYDVDEESSSCHEEKIEEKLEALDSPRSCKLDNRKSSHSSSSVVDHITNNCGLGETTRRIYRSLNMMVPRPLPSLLELDREIKRSRF